MTTTLRPAQAQALIRAVVPYIDGTPPDPYTTVVTAGDLSFFPGWRLLCLQDEAKCTPRRWPVFAGPAGEVVVVDGRAETLYGLAAHVPISLTNAVTAQEYLGVFCALVQTSVGRFQIVEAPEDLDWISDSLTTARKEIGMLLAPVRGVGHGEAGYWRFKMCVILDRTLFAATATITPEGIVDIVQDAVLATGLPVRDDRLGALG